MNPVLESLFKHQSIRKYKDQPLEEEKLDLIIKAAQVAPNWCNGQQVTIIAVQEPECKQRLSVLCTNQPYVASCSVFLVFCADYYRASLAFEKIGHKDFAKKYIEQLDVLFVGSHDVGIAMQNAVVAAESMGLGTVPIGTVRSQALEVVKELNLPKYVIPIVGLCVGYPDDNPGIKPRLPSKAVCFKEKYDTSKLQEEIDGYDNQFQKYLSERSTNDRDANWSSRLYDLYSASYNSGRYNGDYELLKQQGFIEIEKKK
ncbi:Nitro/flavin reductase [Anaeromyces robustus]|uniref:Nitro/flavin reductase n=1 Tax=Anaeromyces robustus TaxID=1754192 RepID=A0A1Y1X1D7_9FUNG|nr:Nitro/flavin reductase [Anaeromyces robustus]|eukprot:ORX79512.1 Nitro/flavin reductase [Anaeromyces robustus]